MSVHSDAQTVPLSSPFIRVALNRRMYGGAAGQVFRLLSDALAADCSSTQSTLICRDWFIEFDG